MEKDFKEIYEIKIDIKSAISDRLFDDDITYRLIADQNKQNDILRKINMFIPQFMVELWKNPSSMSTILLNSDKDDIKKNLAPFIIHNLYENIPSLNHHNEDQLIYIISLILKEEINSLKNIDSSFLSETCAGIILEELNKKKEVKFFFKNILFEIIKKLEYAYSSEKIIFSPAVITEDILNNNIPSKIESKEYEEKINIINDKYLFLSFNKEELNKKILETKDKEMKDFLQSKMVEIESSPEIYTNENLLGFLYYDSEKSQNYINYYMSSFIQVIDGINMLFDNLLNNSESLPYLIKCICKIISILIKKKFPKQTKIEQNKFLVIFFFHKLLFPLLIEPNLNLFINEYIISDSTKTKLNMILTILDKLIFGKLIDINYLSPFNWYIIEKMPKLIELLDEISEVKLPNFIEKLINDELPGNYEYDYFKENPDDILIFRNICYNSEELYSLIINSEKCKDNILINKKIISKLISNINIVEKIMNKKEYIEIEQENSVDNFSKFKRVVNSFLLTDSIYNKKLDSLIKKEQNKKFFNLEELKQIENEEQRTQNQIIKIKNYLCSLLYNNQILSISNFKKEKLSNIIDILNELKKQLNQQSNYKNKEYIPSKWYIDSLLQYLPTLPNNLIANDYEELLNELEKDLIDSIKEIDFDKLSQFIEYSKEIENEKYYYENIKKIIYDMNLNEKAKTIINNECFSVNNNEDKNIYDFFTKISETENFSKLFRKQENKISNTIKSFINNFPRFTKYQMGPNTDYFDLMIEKKVDKIVENYSIIIYKTLKKNNIANENNIKNIYNIIFDYIMEQLYDKIFPDVLTNDIDIFQNCIKHRWIDFQNLNKDNKNYIFDNYLPDSINYLKQFEKEKSPRKKLLHLNELFNCIYNLGKFNNDKVDGADDELFLLNYTFIKAIPERIFSNCKYTELFLGNKRLGIEGSQLTKLFSICEKMQHLKFEDLDKISESDYYLNCDFQLKNLL